MDDEGHVGVMWYDRRNNPANVAFDVYFAFSTDGGATFSPNLRVTDVISDPTTGPIFIGDYNGLTAQGNAFFPLWTDLRNWNLNDATTFGQIFNGTSGQECPETGGGWATCSVGPQPDPCACP